MSDTPAVQAKEELPVAPATQGYHRVVVTDCPYCHGQHSHSGEGRRMAECLQGMYIVHIVEVSK